MVFLRFSHLSADFQCSPARKQRCQFGKFAATILLSVLDVKTYMIVQYGANGGILRYSSDLREKLTEIKATQKVKVMCD